MGDRPHSQSYRTFFAGLRLSRYSHADLRHYGEVVQEDGLCGGPCVAEAISGASPCAPFTQYAYASDANANRGMWHFVVVAFERDKTGWRVIGLLADSWSPYCLS